MNIQDMISKSLLEVNEEISKMDGKTAYKEAELFESIRATFLNSLAKSSLNGNDIHNLFYQPNTDRILKD